MSEHLHKELEELIKRFAVQHGVAVKCVNVNWIRERVLGLRTEYVLDSIEVETESSP